MCLHLVCLRNHGQRHIKHHYLKQHGICLKERRAGLYHVLQDFPNIARYMANRYISPSIPVTLIAAENVPGKNTLKTERERMQWRKCLKEFGSGPNRRYVFAEGASPQSLERTTRFGHP